MKTSKKDKIFSEKISIYKEYLELKDIPPDFDFSDEDYTEDDIKDLLNKAGIDAGKTETSDKLTIVSDILDQVPEEGLIKLTLWLDIPKDSSLDDIYKLFSVLEKSLPENTALDYSLTKTRTEKEYVMKYVMWQSNA